MLKNDELYDSLVNKISKNKYFKKKLIKKESFYEDTLNKKKYDLIINCDSNNLLSNKFFTKKIQKNYDNFAYTTILKHKKIKNNVATQIFTKVWTNCIPANLQIYETSIVCSLRYQK